MKRILRLIVFVACMAGLPGENVAEDFTANTEPATAANTRGASGDPLVFTGRYHLALPSSPFPMSAVDLSPDGTSAFTFEEGQGLWIAKFASMSPTLLSEQRLLPRPTHHMPFTWARDSNEILGARQATDRSGFAIGQLKAFSITGGGVVTEFPPMMSSSGELDELFWIGGNGLAVAAFGTQGSFYRPERSNLHPSMAIVNTRAGRILQEVKFSYFPGRPTNPKVEFVLGHVDRSGRVRTVVGLSPNLWFFWVQGERPLLLPISEPIAGKPVALSPDGRRLLVMQNLSATGVICERNADCPSLMPSHGDVAKLLDLSNGKTVWSIQGVAEHRNPSIRPAFSVDGRYALISMPEQNGKSPIAVVLISSGEIIQELPALGSRHRSFGFSPDGRRAWTVSGSELNIYAIP